MKQLVARYPGICQRCGQGIVPGDNLAWDPVSHASWHPGCLHAHEAGTAERLLHAGEYRFFWRDSGRPLHYTFNVRRLKPEDGLEKLVGQLVVMIGEWKVGWVTAEGEVRPFRSARPDQVKALERFTQRVVKDVDDPAVVYLVEVRCFRCLRRLRSPLSLARGLGPECVKHEVGGLFPSPSVPALPRPDVRKLVRCDDSEEPAVIPLHDVDTIRPAAQPWPYSGPDVHLIIQQQQRWDEERRRAKQRRCLQQQRDDARRRDDERRRHQTRRDVY